MKTYTIYLRHVTDADLYYVGVSSNMKTRGRNYRNGRLRNYIQSNNADKAQNVRTYVLYKTNNKDKALILEQRFISTIPKEKLLNMKNSGGAYRRDKRQANREWYRNSDEAKRKSYDLTKKRRSTPRGKIYYRVDNWNRIHPGSELVTPQEAVDMFELTGWVPPFVKNNDLIN